MNSVLVCMEWVFYILSGGVFPYSHRGIECCELMIEMSPHGR